MFCLVNTTSKTWEREASRCPVVCRVAVPLLEWTRGMGDGVSWLRHANELCPVNELCESMSQWCWLSGTSMTDPYDIMNTNMQTKASQNTSTGKCSDSDKVIPCTVHHASYDNGFILNCSLIQPYCHTILAQLGLQINRSYFLQLSAWAMKAGPGLRRPI